MKFSPLFALLTLFVAGSFSATSTYAQVISSGSACHSITPSQATKFEWRAEGIKNGDPSNNWWVNCPFQRPPGKSELSLSLRVANTTDSSISIECNFREMYNGSRIQGTPVSSNVPGGEARTLTWTMQPKQASSVTNAACKLPDGLQIEASIADYSGRCTNQDVEGYWAITSGEGYDGAQWYVGSFDADGTFKFIGYVTDYGSIEGTGTYQLDDCYAEAEIYWGGVTVYLAGFIGHDKQAIQGLTYNEGYYGGGNMTKLSPLSDSAFKALGERKWTPAK